MCLYMVSLPSSGQACSCDFAHPGNWHRLWLTVLFQSHLLLLTILKHTMQDSNLLTLLLEQCYSTGYISVAYAFMCFNMVSLPKVSSYCLLCRQKFSLLLFRISRTTILRLWNPCHTTPSVCTFYQQSLPLLRCFGPLTPRDGATGLAGQLKL